MLRHLIQVSIIFQDERTALHETCRSQSRDENGLAIITCHLVEANADINAKSSDVGEVSKHNESHENKGQWYWGANDLLF